MPTWTPLRRAGEQLDALIAAAGTTENGLGGGFQRRAPASPQGKTLVNAGAVLGRRVRDDSRELQNTVDCFAPDLAFAEARERLPRVLVKQRVPVALGPAKDVR